MKSSRLSEWYIRLKVERYLGVPPFYLVNHPKREELIQQAFDAMWIDAEIENVLRAKANKLS